MVRCPCPSALKCDALWPFCGDGFLGFELKLAILPPIHAKLAESARPTHFQVTAR